MVFPHTGYAVISVTIPRSLPEGDLLERVVRQAHRVCLTAIRAEEGIRAITIRMLKPPSGSRHPVIAFSGNTDRKTLQQYRDSNLEFGVLWDHVFESVWWNPRVGGSMPVEMQQRSAAGLP